MSDSSNEYEEKMKGLAKVLLADSVKRGATEIRLEPSDKQLTVRFRVGGVLRDAMSIPLGHGRQLVIRFKVMATLGAEDYAWPAIGVVHMRWSEDVDGPSWFHVTSVPTSCGEKIIVRRPRVDQSPEWAQPLPGGSCDRCGQEPRGGRCVRCDDCMLTLCEECHPHGRGRQCIECEGAERA